jgi:uncharacterized damage-inducible protein DinB
MMTTLLEEALDAWKGARSGVIAEFENIPKAKFDAEPGPDLRSPSALGRHILEVAKVMVGELTREDGDFRRQAFPAFLSEYAGDVERLVKREALLTALRKQLEEGTKAFRQAGEIHMLQHIRRFDGLNGTRLAWMHHGIAQEEYHRGQLAWAARLFGSEPALTKLIRGTKVGPGLLPSRQSGKIYQQ